MPAAPRAARFSCSQMLPMWEASRRNTCVCRHGGRSLRCLLLVSLGILGPLGRPLWRRGSLPISVAVSPMYLNGDRPPNFWVLPVASSSRRALTGPPESVPRSPSLMCPRSPPVRVGATVRGLPHLGNSPPESLRGRSSTPMHRRRLVVVRRLVPVGTSLTLRVGKHQGNWVAASQSQNLKRLGSVLWVVVLSPWVLPVSREVRVALCPSPAPSVPLPSFHSVLVVCVAALRLSVCRVRVVLSRPLLWEKSSPLRCSRDVSNSNSRPWKNRQMRTSSAMSTTDSRQVVALPEGSATPERHSSKVRFPASAGVTYDRIPLWQLTSLAA